VSEQLEAGAVGLPRLPAEMSADLNAALVADDGETAPKKAILTWLQEHVE